MQYSWLPDTRRARHCRKDSTFFYNEFPPFLSHSCKLYLSIFWTKLVFALAFFLNAEILWEKPRQPVYPQERVCPPDWTIHSGCAMRRQSPGTFAFPLTGILSKGLPFLSELISAHPIPVFPLIILLLVCSSAVFWVSMLHAKVCKWRLLCSVEYFHPKKSDIWINSLHRLLALFPSGRSSLHPEKSEACLA
jgi:hypothetical protein